VKTKTFILLSKNDIFIVQLIFSCTFVITNVL